MPGPGEQQPEAPTEFANGGNGDLSQGTLPPTITRAKANLGLEEHSHRLSLQRSVAYSAMAFVALLFLVAVFYGGVILYLLVGDPSGAVHWHASILVAAFVVPPTVMLVALLRSVYAASEDEKNQSLLPVVTMLKDTALAIAGMFKKG